MGKNFETDVVIIGAGPVGLFAVFECGMMKMNCHVVDTLDFIGGQCTALYPEKPIYDIPAHPQISAEQLIKNLEQQAAPFNPVYHLGQQVVSFSESGDDIIVRTSTGNEITCKAVIIAAGCGAFGPNRPPLADIESYEGKSVFYMVGRKEDFRNKKVVIAGGGDSAVDWALSLADIAEKLYVVHRRDKFRCAPDSSEKLHQLADSGAIELVIPYQLDSLEGRNGELSAVNVKTLDGNLRAIEADILLPFFGLAMELGPIADWGLSLDKNLIEVEQNTMQTSHPKIFAVGDIASYNNKLKLILSGFAEAATAAHSAYPLVHNQAYHFEYSTTSGVPK
ncbi:MAG: ferredoxin--NADP(+) reductase [Alphaproteobacteria bacterium CG11_big_fil_rev_8_21_14_0_20_44_7]|nr:MAG: ferredoxin--NADP(+) reductase [Alphaproteobacteria bacterium CG11_big_fil_rev_8_21_14_0_20_44_7]